MIVMAVGLAAIALLIGKVPLWLVMAMAVFAGFGYPAVTGAWSAQLPRLIPGTAITRAYSADAATYSVAAVVAPADRGGPRGVLPHGAPLASRTAPPVLPRNGADGSAPTRAA